MLWVLREEGFLWCPMGFKVRLGMKKLNYFDQSSKFNFIWYQNTLILR